MDTADIDGDNRDAGTGLDTVCLDELDSVEQADEWDNAVALKVCHRDLHTPYSLSRHTDFAVHAVETAHMTFCPHYDNLPNHWQL